MKSSKSAPTPEEIGSAVGIPKGKKMSVLNLAKAGTGAAKKRRAGAGKGC